MTQLAAAFDNDPQVLEAFERARASFETWAANDVTDPPPDHPIDAVQIALMRWQRNRFGMQTETHDLRMAHGVIEEMGETFLADENAEDALDGLGDVLVYASQLVTSNRLAIAPILELARDFAARPSIPPIVAAAMLSQVTLKASQKIRGLDDVHRYRVRLVGCLAQCIAIALTDVEILHNLKVDAGGVLLVVANEVIQRGVPGHDAIPKDVEPEITAVMLSPEEIAARDAARKDRALRSMQTAIGKIDTCPTCGAAFRTPHVDDSVSCLNGHEWTGMQLAAMGVVVPGRDYVIEKPPAFDVSDAHSKPDA